jgi:hypothetical protein
MSYILCRSVVGGRNPGRGIYRSAGRLGDEGRVVNGGALKVVNQTGVRCGKILVLKSHLWNIV